MGDRPPLVGDWLWRGAIVTRSWCYDLPRMNRVALGILLGIAAGTASVLLMLPLEFPDRQTALLGAFSDRFALGFLTANVVLPVRGALAGILVGLLISIPSAIVTKAYAPVLGLGVIMGAICGWAAERFGARAVGAARSH